MPRKGKKKGSQSLTISAEDNGATLVEGSSTTQVSATVGTIKGMEDFYELDQDGDAVLTLLVPRESTTDAHPVGEAIPKLPERILPELEEYPPASEGIAPEVELYLPPNPEARPEGGEEWEREAPTEELGSLADLDVNSLGSEDTFSVIPTEPDCDPPASEPQSHRKISFLVSASLLRLVSPVFRTLLQQSVQDGVSNRITIALQNDDPHTLLTLLYIIHHHARKVPHALPLDSLTQMAVLVDKYNCVEAVEPFSGMWIDKLKDDRPNAFSDTLLQWLYVAWVFGDPQEFQHATGIVERESCGNDIAEKVKGLPIPDSVLEAICDARQEALAGLITMLQELVDRYKESETIHCTRRNSNCDALILGSLIRNMKATGLLPSPTPPYEGLSFVRLVETIVGMSLPTFCTQQSHYYGYGGPCGVKESIGMEARRREEGLKGLELRVFEDLGGSQLSS